jgi:hypothetical protein
MTEMMIVQIGQDIPHADNEKLIEYIKSMLNIHYLEEQESTFTGHTTDDGGLHSIYLKTLKSKPNTYFARVTVINSSGLVSKITICSD